MLKILDSIHKENDIKKVPKEYYKALAQQIRKFLVKNVSETGGHLSSNLGAVELTMALHLCMDFPKDKLIWDVGHQAYTHKILTGRKDEFSTLRQYGGLCGFPKMSESDCDAFSVGHSSTSISAGVGYVRAREVMGQDYKVAAVIGDGALSGGMAFEALNNAARLKSNMVIVLNDNNMSISENVGGMANYLGKIRIDSSYEDFKGNVETAIRKIPKLGNSIVEKLKKSKDSIKRLVIPGMLFEDMGLTYMGPIDGHDIELLIKAFHTAFRANKPVIVHVITKKGKGYKIAEENPSKFHGVDPFYPHNGEMVNTEKKTTYTDIFSENIRNRAANDDKIYAITAAMPGGTGLDLYSEEFPERFSDVGIAEEHAVTFAAGLAAAGLTPVVAIYSTFLQRAYDQILHDVCLNNLHVIFAVDRAGIVGKDGATHQGMFDLSYLTSIPGLTVMAPMNGKELNMMFEFAYEYNAPVAIRYPRGSASMIYNHLDQPIEYGKAQIIFDEMDIALLAIGSMVSVASQVRDELKNRGYNVSLVNLRFASPLDKDTVLELTGYHNIIVSMEENVHTGGIGQQIADIIMENSEYKGKFIDIALPDRFVEHGDVESLYKETGLDMDSIVNRIISGKE